MQMILKIMRAIYENPERLTEADFISVVGPAKWMMFSQFAFPYYCRVHGMYLRLTPEGVSEFHRLILEQNNNEKTSALVLSTGSMALATILLVINSIIPFESMGVSESTIFGILVVMGALLLAVSLKKIASGGI